MPCIIIKATFNELDKKINEYLAKGYSLHGIPFDSHLVRYNEKDPMKSDTLFGQIMVSPHGVGSEAKTPKKATPGAKAGK